MENVLIVIPRYFYSNSSLLFYDWSLNLLNLSLSNSKIIYLQKIVAFYKNDIVLKKSSDNL